MENELTPAQAEALTLTSGGSIIAPAGSGKTRTIIAKVQHDQKAQGIVPGDQIILTFTNVAAAEFRDRLDAQRIECPWHVGTLHSLAFYLIRTSWGSDVEVMNDKAFDDLIKATAKRTRINVTKKAARKAIVEGKKTGNLGLMAKAIMKDLQTSRKMHPDAMLPIALGIIQNAQLNGNTVYVDEAQDSAPADLAIYRELARNGRLYMIGDPRQAIFGFRGADPSIFQNQVLKGRSVELTQNFRSGIAIIKAGNAIAKQMPGFLGKLSPMEPGRPDFGGLRTPPVFYPSTEREALGIASDIKAAGMTGTIAILTRYNATADLIFDVLAAEGIGVVHRSKERPADPREDALAAMTLVPDNDQDWADALSAMNFSFAEMEKMIPILKAAEEITEVVGLYRESIGRPKPGTNVVEVGTIHSAKGAEFDHVFLAGADDASFAQDDPDALPLLYVAITRARASLGVSAAASRPGFIRSTDLTFSKLLNAS